MQSQLQDFHLPPPPLPPPPLDFESDEVTSHKDGCQYSLKLAVFETNVSLIKGTLETKTPVSEKAGCLLALGQEQKSKVFWSDPLL